MFICNVYRGLFIIISFKTLREAWISKKTLIRCQQTHSKHALSGRHFQSKGQWRTSNFTGIIFYLSWLDHFKFKKLPFQWLLQCVRRSYFDISPRVGAPSSTNSAFTLKATPPNFLPQPLQSQLAAVTSLIKRRETQRRFVLTKADPAVTHAEQRTVEALK